MSSTWEREMMARDRLAARRHEAAAQAMSRRRGRHAARVRELGWLENDLFSPGFPLFGAGAWAFELAFEPPASGASRGSLIL